MFPYVPFGLIALLVGYKLVYKKVVMETPLLDWLRATELWVGEHLTGPWVIRGKVVSLHDPYFAMRPISKLIKVLNAPIKFEIRLSEMTRKGKQDSFVFLYGEQSLYPSVEVQQLVTRKLASLAHTVHELESQRIELFNALCVEEGMVMQGLHMVRLSELEIELKYELADFEKYHRVAKFNPWVVVLPSWREYVQPGCWPNMAVAAAS